MAKESKDFRKDLGKIPVGLCIPHTVNRKEQTTVTASTSSAAMPEKEPCRTDSLVGTRTLNNIFKPGAHMKE